MPELAGTERLGAERGQLNGKGGAVESDEVGVLRCGGGRGGHRSMYIGRSGAYRLMPQALSIIASACEKPASE